MKNCIFNRRLVMLFLATGLVACGNNGGNNKQMEGVGTKFAPKERTSSLTDVQRQKAIAQQKVSHSIDYEALVVGRGIKLSVLQPITGGDVTDHVADRLSGKMLEMTARNGISGLGTNPNFVLGAQVNQTGRAATATTPQKMTVQYEIIFKVLNAITGDVFGISAQEVTGAGNSFEEASVNAMNEIKNTPEFQKFLAACSDRIVGWYEENISVIQNQVLQAEAEGNFALALALLNSVPEQATQAYRYASEQQPKTLEAMLHKQAADMLGSMEAAMAASGDDFTPAVGAYFSLIPVDCPEHATAQKLYAEYEKKCQARRAALEAKAEKDEAAARELEKLNMLYEHEEELAQKEVDKVVHVATAKASAAAANAAAKTRPSGLFGSIGYAITTVTDKIFNE